MAVCPGIFKVLKCNALKVVWGVFIFLPLMSQWPDVEKQLFVQNKKVVEILDSLSQAFNINFSFNSELKVLQYQKSISGQATLEAFLKQLLPENEAGYMLVDQQVVIFPVLNTVKGASVNKPVEGFRFVHGKVSNATSNEPLAFASVGICGTGIATITNANGWFSLKIPQLYLNDSMSVAFIGFNQQKIAIASIPDTINLKLIEQVYIFQPVTIKPVDAEQLVLQAIKATKQNFSRQSAIYAAFYRETTSDNDELLTISEALLDIAKAPYGNSFVNDQARVFKGRKKENNERMRKMQYKLEGGVYNSLRLDIVKEEAAFISESGMGLYRYNYKKTVSNNNRSLYAISFVPRPQANEISYQGTLYIDTESKAIVAAYFELSPEGLKQARSVLVKRQPRKTSIKPVWAKYVVFYRLVNGKYYLAYTRADLKIKARSNKLFLNNTFRAVAEMLVTDIDTSNTGRFNRKEIARPTDIFIDNIKSYDESFWESYNTIAPDSKLTEALENLLLLNQD